MDFPPVYECENAQYWENPQYKLKGIIKNNIYLAESQVKKIDVAIKMLKKKSNIEDNKYEQREKEIVYMVIDLSKQQTLNPHVVEFYEIFQENENTFIVMENCDGDLKSEFENLHNRVNPIEIEKKTLEILKQIVKGYNYLLEKFNSEFQHRDLKPENILHKKQIYKIADFGLSKLAVDFDNPTKNIGTYFYIAPEVIRGQQYTNTCDIYSLGALVYWLLTQDNGHIIDLQKIQNEYLRGLVRQMVENEPQKRITWNQLLDHDFMNLDSEEVLNAKYVNSRCFSTIIPASPYLSQDVIDSFTNFMIQNEDKSLEKFCKLNRIFINVFKELSDQDFESNRLLFTLWIKILDKEVGEFVKGKQRLEQEKLKYKKNSIKIDELNDQNAKIVKLIKDINIMIERISVQQLIRIKQIQDHTIEFMEINEICEELKKKQIKNQEFQKLLKNPQIL